MKWSVRDWFVSARRPLASLLNTYDLSAGEDNAVNHPQEAMRKSILEKSLCMWTALDIREETVEHKSHTHKQAICWKRRIQNPTS